MFEYIFFHQSLADAFTEQLQKLSIPFESRDDAMGFVVALPDNLDSELMERVDEHYAALLEQSESLLTADGEMPTKHAAGITLTLRDGRTVQALVRPELLNKMLDAISYDELNEFVEAIAGAVDNPDERPICQR